MDKAKLSVVILDLLVIGMLSFVFINLVTIPLISPDSGMYTNERSPELLWGGMQNNFVVYIDDDPELETPVKKEVTGNFYKFAEDLDFGTYYWKVESGVVVSEVRKFTVDSSVVLSRDENGVKNEGNVGLLLHRVTGAFVLDIDESLDVESEENVKAEQV